MAVPKGDAADESWRLEEPHERRERLERYAREQRGHTAWLALTGGLFIVAGFGVWVFALLVGREVADRGSGLCFADLGPVFLALVPVGLMRLFAACLSPGDGARRALSKHPVLKFLAIVVMFGGLIGLICVVSQEKMPPERPPGESTVASSRPAEHAAAPQDRLPPEENGGSDRILEGFLALAFFGVGALLMLLSMHPGTAEAAYY